MKLIDIAEIKTGFNLTRKKAQLSQDIVESYNQITLKSFTNLANLDLPKESIEIFHSKEKINKSFFTQEGDILIRLREPISTTYIQKTNENLLVPFNISIVRVKVNYINPKFLLYYLSSNIVKKNLLKYTSNRTMKIVQNQRIITNKELSELQLNIPPLDKQNKLVKFLDASLNEIELLNKLIFQKEKYYNGVLETFIKG